MFFCFGMMLIIGYGVVLLNFVELVFLSLSIFFVNLIIVYCIFKYILKNGILFFFVYFIAVILFLIFLLLNLFGIKILFVFFNILCVFL